MRELEGQVAVVTGGGRGIGAAVALGLARRGARVAVVSRSAAELEQVAAAIEREGGSAMALAGDVTSPADMEAVFARCRAAFGPVDILVNNAGIMHLKPFREETLESWRRVQAVNVEGAFICTQLALQDMEERGRGVIVNTGSIWGYRGGPLRSAYVASKHALLGLTRALAAEYAHTNIRVAAVCFGPVATELTRRLNPNADQTGWLSSEEAAEVIVWLCTPAGAALHGSIVDVPGRGRPIGL